MDIMTGVGLVAGIVVISVMMLLGGDLHMFISEHALIIIFGGSVAATMIRFPLGVMLHGLPLGAKYAFTMSRLSARDLVDELARIAEIARKQGPVGLEKVETNEPFLAKGIRYVADGYDLEFIRDKHGAGPRQFPDASRRGQQDLPRHRRLRAGVRHDRHADRHGADVCQHDRPVEARPVLETAPLATLYGALVANLFVFRSPTSCTASFWTRKPTAR